MSTTRIIKLEDTIRLGFERVYDKQDDMKQEISNIRVDVAAKAAIQDGKADALHDRLDEHEEEHKEGKKWWLALWATAIASAISAAMAWITGKRDS